MVVVAKEGGEIRERSLNCQMNELFLVMSSFESGITRE